MTDPKNTSDNQVTHKPADETAAIGAKEEDFVPVGGPRSGDDETGTEDSGIEPEEEITPG